MKNFNHKMFLRPPASYKAGYQITARRILRSAVFALILPAIFAVSLPLDNFIGKNQFSESASIALPVKADSTYFNFSTGNLTLNITPSTTGLITSNDNWSGVPGVEGYCGDRLTATHGTNPQTVITTEFSILPTAGKTCVNANKGQPDAFNAGGITEFDRNGTYAIGFQGNVQANPYLVFYLNTIGQSTVRISYDLIDIDNGSNNSVSPIALQYRVGDTGTFTNLSAGYVADVTDGPNISGRKTSRSVQLPADALNQPKVQVRLITTDAAGSDGRSTPDEWIGVNNILITNLAPTAASVSVSGRAVSALGYGLPGVRIVMQDSRGNLRSTMTNAFGFYRFGNVSLGENYYFSAYGKRQIFLQPTQFLSPLSDHNELNFVAQ